MLTDKILNTGRDDREMTVVEYWGGQESYKEYDSAGIKSGPTHNYLN